MRVLTPANGDDYLRLLPEFFQGNALTASYFPEYDPTELV
jgi:hypothetical protein